MEKPLTVIIPAYNAAQTITEVVNGISAVAKQKRLEIDRVYVIEDGSEDGTAEVLTDLEARHDFLAVVRKPQNEGASAAIRDGISNALTSKNSNRVFLRMDADMEHQPADIPRLFRPIARGGTAMAIGYTPFSLREGVLYMMFNRYAGTRLSEAFLDVSIPQFSPGFYAVSETVLRQIWGEAVRYLRRYRERFGREMVTLDFLTLVLCCRRNGKPAALKLRPVRSEHWEKPSIGKLYRYWQSYRKTKRFLKDIIRGDRP